ncbi:MAG TPA: energy transducer TonB [Pyrinomonadaceae bacterium]|nr:energy transducer TonB [Pyrinomonadaceae bacterium]
MLRRFLTAVMFVAGAFVVAFGQASDEEAVRRLTQEGVRAYKDGRFIEAQQLFARALELDPRNMNLPVFVARATHQQYKPGLDTPENRAKAEEAIVAYKRVIEDSRMDEKARDDSFNAVAYLYRQLRDEEQERAWLLARAEDPATPPAKRADAYAILASKGWRCSYDITEQQVNKKVVEAGGGPVVQYLKPKTEGDFDTARRCATDGLNLAVQAIALHPLNVSTWAYKATLLREHAKLAEMEEDSAAKAKYERQAGVAQSEAKRLREEEEESRRRTEETGNGGPSGPVGPTISDAASDGQSVSPPRAKLDTRRTTVSAGVLNGKVIHKPAPVYPREAKDAKASGVVTVRVVLDEEGRVTSAVAESGHELLRQPAVEAVRQWRFSRTTLSGQPVKVTGIVTLFFKPR